MNDTAIKNFAVWARRQLIEDVKQQMAKWAIDEQGTVPATADVLNGNVLTPQQREQRAELLRLCKTKGADQLAEQAAYTWFNRFLAIRFMELHDYLPCGLRFFSSAGGTFDPQVLKEALRVEIDGLGRNQVLTAIREGDEPLFRVLFIAQCNELADCMPAVFEHVGSAMELLLPENLQRDGGVLSHMVLDIPESDWLEGVEIVGWMYQYYVSERKDEVFASFKKGKKAERDAIAPATQLFTPHWIVRYLTENSLGRLWMLNRPNSQLASKMDYYIAPDADAHEDVLPIASPEEITVCDPACGSGHILVYAFDVLAAIYEECGYMRRDIPRLILEKNLSGMEIDPRAAAMASFALTMKAMEWDSRFLSRGVSPDITVMQPVTFEDEELERNPRLAEQKHLIDIAAHMDECGSLFNPEASDIFALETIRDSISNNVDIFTCNTADKIQRLIGLFKSLARMFTVVIANPPYMGSSNMDKWTAGFTKKNYPDSKRDLCTCFIERGLSFLKQCGLTAMVTAQSWMFISSFEALRNQIVDSCTLLTLLDTKSTGYHSDLFTANAAFVLSRNHHPHYLGAYLKLDVPIEEKANRCLEAIANPDRGWFYRADADTFKQIPGTPIAYWVSEAMRSAFNGIKLSMYGKARHGLKTGNNEKYLKYWFEVPIGFIDFRHDINEPFQSNWAPHSKGGDFRKWYGNNDYVVFYKNDGEAISQSGATTGSDCFFKAGITWTALTSSYNSFRYMDIGYTFDSNKGPFLQINKCISLYYVLAYLNSSTSDAFRSVLNPSLSLQIVDVDNTPFLVIDFRTSTYKQIEKLTVENVNNSRADWDLDETSWNFSRNGLI